MRRSPTRTADLVSVVRVGFPFRWLVGLISYSDRFLRLRKFQLAVVKKAPSPVGIFYS